MKLFILLTLFQIYNPIVIEGLSCNFNQGNLEIIAEKYSFHISHKHEFLDNYRILKKVKGDSTPMIGLSYDLFLLETDKREELLVYGGGLKCLNIQPVRDLEEGKNYVAYYVKGLSIENAKERLNSNVNYYENSSSKKEPYWKKIVSERVSELEFLENHQNKPMVVIFEGKFWYLKQGGFVLFLSIFGAFLLSISIITYIIGNQYFKYQNKI